MAVEVKTIGSSGQISLGKQHAGQVVTVERREDGVWVIMPAKVIPENEMWFHTPEVQERVRESLNWLERNPAADTDLDALEMRVKGDSTPLKPKKKKTSR